MDWALKSLSSILWPLNTTAHLRKARLLGEMANTRLWQKTLRWAWNILSSGNLWRTSSVISKAPMSQLAKTPMAKIGATWIITAVRIIKCMEFKHVAVSIHEFIRTLKKNKITDHSQMLRIQLVRLKIN